MLIVPIPGFHIHSNYLDIINHPDEVIISLYVAIFILLVSAAVFFRKKRTAETKLQEMDRDFEKQLRDLRKMNAGEKRFSAITDHATDIILLEDEQLNTIYINHAIEEVTGYTPEEMKTKKVIDLVYPDDYELWKTLYSELMSKPGIPIHRSIRLVHKNGNIVWLEGIVINLLHNETIKAVISSYRDITARKQAEESLKKLNDELKHKVTEHAEQLQMVNKELESFSYSVSHDLRAPLRAVSGYSKIIEEDYSKIIDDEGKRLLTNIQYNAQKMGTLIDDLLSFSRLGRKEVQKSDIRAEELLEGVLIELNKAIKHSATIKIHTLHDLNADYALINQVFYNLISNAIKYSSKKENAVVEISSQKKNNDIIYTISDNGAGFDMKYGHKLFGVFQRLHADTEFEGTGVGLAIVQRIIIKHGGKVWGEGIPGKGASFHFSVPVKE